MHWQKKFYHLNFNSHSVCRKISKTHRKLLSYSGSVFNMVSIYSRWKESITYFELYSETFIFPRHNLRNNLQTSTERFSKSQEATEN